MTCSVLPDDPDGVCAMSAALWWFSEADICVFVDAALVHKEVLMHLHNRCQNKQKGGKALTGGR